MRALVRLGVGLIAVLLVAQPSVAASVDGSLMQAAVVPQTADTTAPSVGSVVLSPTAVSTHVLPVVGATATDDTGVTSAEVRVGGVGVWTPMGTTTYGWGAASQGVATQLLAGATAITTGSDHACALLADGTVWCWGGDGYGQLGPATNTTSYAPVKVTGLAGVTSVKAGGFFTCALLASGAVSCWGYNANGQLGDGTMAQSATPVAVSGISNAVAIAAGARHACAVLADGTVKCWGYNLNGELGDATTTDRHTPVTVSGLTGATVVGAGSYHTCAIATAGALWCWGKNASGQLGVLVNGSATTPQRVTGLAPAAGAVAGGLYHTCALTTAGAVWCWGGNSSGQVGDGTTYLASFPKQILAAGSATAVDAGDEYTCAVLTSTAASCWGNNGYGQIGDGTLVNRLVPTTVSSLSGATAVGDGFVHTCSLLADHTLRCWGGFGDLLGNGASAGSPVPVGVQGIGALGVNEIGTAPLFEGAREVCVRASDAALNRSADADACAVMPVDLSAPALTTPGLSPAALAAGYTIATTSITDAVDVADASVQVDGGSWVGMAPDDGAWGGMSEGATARLLGSAIAAGSGDAYTCALLADGTVWCWGSNASGQLGDGTTTPSRVPVRVNGISTAVALTVGPSHACALLEDGTAACWGGNGSGQLGDTTYTNRLTPVAVVGLSGATALGAGRYQTCAVASGGTLWCWGSNGFGQLGDGTNTGRTTPVAVVDGLSVPVTGAVAVTSGERHSCALMGDQTVWCWGRNDYGQLGEGGTATSYSTPRQVSSLTGVVKVAAGGLQTCAVLAAGGVRCWGDDAWGQLGNNSYVPASTPVAVWGITSATTLSVGEYHVCAVLADETVSCWGRNDDGEYGNGTTKTSRVPVAIGADDLIVAVSAGLAHTCGLAAGGRVECWGANGSGQLGDGQVLGRLIPAPSVGVGAYASATLAEGAHEVCVRAVDAVENLSDGTACTTLLVDRTAPSVASFTSAATTPSNALSVPYTLTFDAAVAGIGAADFVNVGTATGCSFSPSAAGGSSVTVTASGCSASGTLIPRLLATAVTDEAGNAGPTADVDATTVITLDRGAPSVAITGANGASRTFPWVTSATLASVRGSCSTGDGTVAVTLDGVAANPASAACSAGAWSLTLAAGISVDGTHALEASQTDAAGNHGSSGTVTITVDKTAPSSKATVAAAYTTGTAVSVAWTATDTGSGTQFVTVYYAPGGVVSAAVACVGVSTSATSGTLTCTIPATDGNYGIFTRATDLAGNLEAAPATVDDAIVRDATAPTATAPLLSLRAGAVLAGAALPVQIAWTGADAGTGIARYEISRSLDGGTTWSVVSTSATSSPYATTTTASGTARYRVRAVDKAGNVGAWATGEVLSPRLVQENAVGAGLTFAGTWAAPTHPSYSGGSAKASSTAGSTATYAFTGRAVALVTSVGPGHGSFTVSVDGVTAGTAVSTAAGTAAFGQVIWRQGWTTTGTHTVTITVTGSGAVDIDALEVVFTDTAAPTISVAPTVGLRTGAAASATSLPVTVSWTGTDGPGGSLVAVYQVARTTDDGLTWTTLASAVTTTALATSVPGTGTASFRVRAVDRAGNVGAWIAGMKLTPSLAQTETGLAWTGVWTAAAGTSYSGGSVRYSITAGSSATYSFTGRSVALVMTRATTRGAVRVYVDGAASYATVDSYAAATAYAQQVWSKSWAASGVHTVKVVVVGTSGRARVDLDAISVLK